MKEEALSSILSTSRERRKERRKEGKEGGGREGGVPVNGSHSISRAPISQK